MVCLQAAPLLLQQRSSSCPAVYASNALQQVHMLKRQHHWLQLLQPALLLMLFILLLLLLLLLQHVGHNMLVEPALVPAVMLREGSWRVLLRLLLLLLRDNPNSSSSRNNVVLVLLLCYIYSSSNPTAAEALVESLKHVVIRPQGIRRCVCCAAVALARWHCCCWSAALLPVRLRSMLPDEDSRGCRSMPTGC